MTNKPPLRLRATPAAEALVGELRRTHGAISFYQSHGCCEGSAPLCFAPGEMPLTIGDCLAGEIAGVPFHLSQHQAQYLAGLELTLDVAPGDSGSFSLEEGSGQHFVARFRVLAAEEGRS